MGFLEVLGIIFAVLAGILLGTFAVIYLVVPVFKGLGWLVKHVAKFVWGVLTDSLRFVGAILLGVLYVPLVLGNFVIARFSAASHFGRALTGELGNAFVCLYRVVIGHPARLLCLGGLTEGLERRLPAVMAGAPTADLPKGGGKRGLFDGYSIVGSLPGGGSGAKLYVAEPDAVKLASFNRSGISVGQVVIKAFSLADGSSLPQIVRESRSLDAAKRLGLILDHDLTAERFHYVMRYVPGESLSLITKQLHASSPPDGLGDAQLGSAVRYAIDLVSTLSVYHRGGLWHKDVKPDNIIVATKSDRRAHLVDFGLVSSLRSAMTLTTHGTEYFRDPEMVRMALRGVKVHEVDGTRFDLYAAGAVLYSMIEDSFPAHGVLSQVERRCPEAVKWVIRRAMTDYDKRYTSADVMLADLSYIADAPDPFAVKPVELPSMGGAAGAVHAPVAFAPVGTAPPIPAVQPPPMPGAAPNQPRAGHPNIRVTNWWSGAARVEGAAPPPAAAGVAAAAVQRAFAAAQQGVAAAQQRLHAAMSAGTPVPPPIPEAAAGEPAAAQARRPAAEQLRSAQERARARRERAQTRLAGVRVPTRHFKAGIGGGVGVSLLIFFGGLFGLGAIITRSIAENERRATVALMHAEEQRDHARAETAEHESGRIATSEASYFEAVQAMEAAAPAPKAQGPSAKPSRGSAKRPTPASKPEPIGRTVLIVSDLKTPISESNALRLRALAKSLDGAGITLIGDTGLPDREPTDAELTTAAEARFALGATPLDSTDAITRINEWVAANAGTVQAVLWVSPSLDPNADAPTLRLFGAGDDRVISQAQLGRIHDVAAAALGKAR